MKTTPIHGLPYAEGTDPAKQFPSSVDQVRTTALDTKLPLPSGLRFAYGSISHACINGWNTATVTFPAGRFTAPPIVSVTGAASVALGLPGYGLGSVTATQLVINVVHGAAQATVIHWIAVGV